MYSRLHKNGHEAALITCRSLADHLPIKTRSRADQNGRFFELFFLTSRRLVNGVFFLLHFGYPQCCYGHISARVRYATVLDFSYGFETSVSYKRTEGR